MFIGTSRSKDIPEAKKAKPSSAFVPEVPDGMLPYGMVERGNDAFEKQGKDTSNLHLILDMTRIGGNLFGVRMEYTYFAPRSGRNGLFQMVLMKWPAQGMMWAVLSFPIEYKPQAEAVANECGLRLADGVPHVFDHSGAHTFPLEGDTVFTLENIHNHQVYSNDAAAYQRLKDEEFAAVDAILQADRIKLKQEFRDRGYTDTQIDRILSRWDAGNEEYDETPAAVHDGSHKHGGPKAQGPK